LLQFSVDSSNYFGLFLTSSLVSTGCKIVPNPKIVMSEKIKVVAKIAGPIANIEAASRARAYAIAPLKPENHITNYILKFILDFSDLYQFTSNETIKMFKNLAKNKFTIVVKNNPTPIVLNGFGIANIPMPKNKNTIVSAEWAITSYNILTILLVAVEIFGLA
jgi:hypothetical protein